MHISSSLEFFVRRWRVLRAGKSFGEINAERHWMGISKFMRLLALPRLSPSAALSIKFGFMIIQLFSKEVSVAAHR